jgi:hypothetical protein
MAIGTRFATLAILGTATVSVSGCGYNTIPTQEEAAKAQWAEVQTQYQRRADLVPNLVATVQGAAKQEKDVLTAVLKHVPQRPNQSLTRQLLLTLPSSQNSRRRKTSSLGPWVV